MNPDHQEARRLLGFRLVHGQWVDQRELAEVVDRREKEPRITASLATEIGGDPPGPTNPQTRRPRGRSRKAEGDRRPAAVVAIEAVLCNRGGTLALLGMEKLKQMGAFQAAETLTWQAVFSPWPPIREAAAIVL